MKVLHLPSNVAGNAYGLVQGERALGLDSNLLSFGKSVYQFPGDISIQNKANVFSKLYNRFKAFTQIRSNYDVFHFNFGSSLFHSLGYGVNLLDLPFYSREAVKVVTYQGCDLRQKYPTIERVRTQLSGDAACFSEGCSNGICNSGKLDYRRQHALEKMMTYCQHAFSLNPDLLHFLPRENSSFLPYTIPNFDLIVEKFESYFKNDCINIVHAPTQRVIKGSDFIMSAIERLREKYPKKINFQLVEDIPYQKALELYRNADLFIDQVLVGWYGGVAVEVMKMGIPVMAYINEHDSELIPQDFVEALPIIRVSKDNIYHKLCDVVKNREMLIESGCRSKDFVYQWHHPNYVASLTKERYLKLKKSYRGNR
jgi:hypothetical protein